MKPIHIENGIVIYYGNRVGTVMDGQAVVDPMFRGDELNYFLSHQRNIREIQWMDGMFDRLANGPKDLLEQPTLKNVRVWQLKPDVDIRMKFIGYEEVCKQFDEPNQENYRLVYDGAVETNDLEALYAKFNLAIPNEYYGHSLSISDVLELYDEQGSAFYYVDKVGFQQIAFATLQQSQTPTSPTMQF